MILDKYKKHRHKFIDELMKGYPEDEIQDAQERFTEFLLLLKEHMDEQTGDK